MGFGHFAVIRLYCHYLFCFCWPALFIFHGNYDTHQSHVSGYTLIHICILFRIYRLAANHPMSGPPNGMHLIIILSASWPLASTSDFAEFCQSFRANTTDGGLMILYVHPKKKQKV